MDFNKIAAKNPNFTDIYYNIAIVEDKMGNEKKSISYFDKAIQLNPNLSDAYLNRGLAEGHEGDFRNACKDWSKAGEMQEYGAYDLIKQYCRK
jgi:tetratricopeptide (TPR) repeat protein